jgi:UDP-N-acetylglucosamine 4-epimerase
MSRSLVTGAAGFIGSHLCERLIEEGHEVIGVDNFATGKPENIAKGVKFVEGDICDFELMVELTRGVDFVFHQAALGSVPRSFKFPRDTNRANVSGFLSVLEASVLSKVKSIVYASSSAVYGDSQFRPKREGEEGNLLSPYAISKRVDELYAQVLAKDITIVGLRYFNVFGPRQDPEGPYAAVIPKWINALRVGERCIINGDGNISRDFCYISNVVDANILAAKSDLGRHEVFNIACGHETTLLELFSMISESLGIEQAEPVVGPPREGDIQFSLADISKAKRLLGYEPKVYVKEGIKLTCSL